MKYFIIVSCLLTLTSFITELSNNKNVFENLYSLKGTWIMKTKSGVIGEEWILKDENYLQSKGFFVKEKDTFITERVALINTAKGIFYRSTATGQNNGQAIDFKLTSADESTNTFVFENPEHDYPKRIVYEIFSADSLHAYIDNGESISQKREDYYYQKTK